MCLSNKKLCVVVKRTLAVAIGVGVRQSTRQQVLTPQSCGRTLHEIGYAPRALDEVVTTEARVGLVVLCVVAARVGEVLGARATVRARRASTIGLRDLVALEDRLRHAAVRAVVRQVVQS